MRIDMRARQAPPDQVRVHAIVKVEEIGDCGKLGNQRLDFGIELGARNALAQVEWVRRIGSKARSNRIFEGH
jgi:hypothetical protein